MRADRLLSLVLLLRRGGRMTAAELARELEVSPRTVLRDVEALSSAGIPVYAERGRDGGFALLPGFTTDLTGLTHDEALALLTAQSRATPDALGLGPAFAAAVRKGVAGMPESTRRTATDAADRVLVRQEWRGGPEPEAALAVVRRAVFAGHRLRLRYRARDGAAPDGTRPDGPGPEGPGPDGPGPDGPGRDEPARWRTVDPVGLVEAGGHWYLLARRDGAERTYRLSRVEECHELDEPAIRGPDADLAAAWQRQRAAFGASRPSLTTTIRVRPDRRAELRAAALDVTADRADGAGWLWVEVAFGDARHGERVLWMLGADVEVLAPEPLRTALAARAAAVTALYA